MWFKRVNTVFILLTFVALSACSVKNMLSSKPREASKSADYALNKPIVTEADETDKPKAKVSKQAKNEKAQTKGKLAKADNPPIVADKADKKANQPPAATPEMKKVAIKKNVKKPVRISKAVRAKSKTKKNYRRPTRNAETATIEGTLIKEYFMITNLTEVEAIDGRHHSSVYKFRPLQTITPGKHTIIIDAAFTRGFASGPVFAWIELPIEIKKNGHYYVKSRIRRGRIYAWIENAKGRRVTEERASVYHLAPKNHRIFHHWDYLTTPEDKEGYHNDSDRDKSGDYTDFVDTGRRKHS